MLEKLSKHIQDWAKGWLVLTLIAIFILFVNLPLGDPELISRSLDGQIGYTPEQAFSTIASYGDAGRAQMIWIHLADMILIALYTSMFCFSISWLFKRGYKPDRKMQQMNLVPLLGGLFDVIENIWILTMILIYPSRPMVIGWLSTIFTTGKYILGVPIILLLLLGLVKAAMNRFKIKDYTSHPTTS
ncbi:MAG: hypothetical protein ACK2T7_13760 [Anaerolineales bacterium]